ncbi:MAG TPA: hypothetical protein GX715_09260 [Armatimonadetes bacterium]|jgi:hypothetical protein|nr:hypothetical protein [Armatimonadota bacterium]
MRRKRRWRALYTLLLLVGGSGALAHFFLADRPVQAGDIRRNPQAFAGQRVTVVGTVSGSASLGGALMSAFGGGAGFFLLDDGSGRIGVTVAGLPPAKGKRVRVRGRVEILASLSIPDSWAKMFGGSGELSAVIVKAEHLSTE